MKFLKNKKGIVESYLPWLLIGLAVLAIVLIIISLLRSEGSSLIDKMKDMFKFGFVFVNLGSAFECSLFQVNETKNRTWAGKISAEISPMSAFPINKEEIQTWPA